VWENMKRCHEINENREKPLLRERYGLNLAFFEQLLGRHNNLLLLWNALTHKKEIAAETFWTQVAGGRCVFALLETANRKREEFHRQGNKARCLGRKGAGSKGGGHVNVSGPAFHLWKLFVANGKK
jgi:hypothetical protein